LAVPDMARASWFEASEYHARVARVQAELRRRGVEEAAIARFASEHDATAAALAVVASGDLLLLLAHEDAAGVLQQLLDAGATLGWS